MADVVDSAMLASYLRTTESEMGDVELLLSIANGLVLEVIAEKSNADEYAASERAVTLEVAARAYRNPDGYASETIDDYTYRRPGDTREAGVYLTDSDTARLRGASSGARLGWLL